jgi:Raf kinase inhibitor-like YbhB/YbcL family protein
MNWSCSRAIKGASYLAFSALLGFSAACSPTSIEGNQLSPATVIPSESPLPEGELQSPDFTLTSSAFEPGAAIPIQYSCEGDDLSPPLSWSSVPEGTSTFALIMEDPDAPGGTWVHWVLYNLPADTRSLKAAIIDQTDLPLGTLIGVNDWGEGSYGGPCPPSGTHRYFFYLFALDTAVDLNNATTDVLRDAFSGHILAQTELVGTFSR